MMNRRLLVAFAIFGSGCGSEPFTSGAALDARPETFEPEEPRSLPRLSEAARRPDAGTQPAPDAASDQPVVDTGRDSQDGSDSAPDAAADVSQDVASSDAGAPDVLGDVQSDWECTFLTLNSENACDCRPEKTEIDTLRCPTVLYSCCAEVAATICRCAGPRFCSDAAERGWKIVGSCPP